VIKKRMKKRKSARIKIIVIKTTVGEE